MLNVKTATKGDDLIITVNMKQEHGDSKSGKTVIVASSQGNQTIEGTGGLVLGLNVYRKK